MLSELEKIHEFDEQRTYYELQDDIIELLNYMKGRAIKTGEVYWVELQKVCVYSEMFIKIARERIPNWKFPYNIFSDYYGQQCLMTEKAPRIREGTRKIRGTKGIRFTKRLRTSLHHSPSSKSSRSKRSRGSSSSLRRRRMSSR